jgi:glucose-1-phosphatase
VVKAFLFDYGGVMTERNGNELTAKLARNLGITDSEVLKILIPSWEQYKVGKISEDELWSAVERLYGQPISVEKRKIWNNWEEMKAIPFMVNLVDKLKAAGYKVGLLSTTVPYTANEIRQSGGYDCFDFLVLSCETGYAKPETEAYKIALDKFEGIKPEEVVFLDDVERYLHPASLLGMKTLHAKSPSQVVRDINELAGIS